MAAFKFIYYVVICWALYAPIGDGLLLHCNKGTLKLSSKDKPTGFLNINCGVHPLAASFPSQNNDRCFSEGGNALKMVTRSGWNAKGDNTPPKTRSKAAQCVLADGQTYIISDSNFVGRMQSSQDFQNEGFGSMVNNFHIGDNGRIYEALGWDTYNEITGGGLNCLRIAFVKNSSDQPPSQEAVMAYKALIKTAICLGKLVAHYKLFPYYLIDDRYSLGESSFERNGMRNWENYYTGSDLIEGLYFGKYPIVFREEWATGKAEEKWLNYTSPAKYVVVGHFNYRCFLNCIEQIRWRERVLREKKKDVHINFYVGDDGLSYESYGWDNTWGDYLVNAMIVQIDFLGKFQSYRPSDRALKSFTRLLRLGVIWGKLSPDYKIVSYKQIEDDPNLIGNALDEVLKKMPRYASVF